MARNIAEAIGRQSGQAGDRCSRPSYIGSRLLIFRIHVRQRQLNHLRRARSVQISIDLAVALSRCADRLRCWTNAGR
jgi:hypothetical protein